MKILILALTALLSAQTPATLTLEKVWETDAALKFPEDMALDPSGQFLYVSNTDGSPLERDGRGSIGRIGLDGKVLDVEWVSGLDAPKGMARRGNQLYTADLAQVVVVDITKAAIVERIPVDGAMLLHNIDIAPDGTVYVSDLFTGKVHAIKDGTVSTYVEGLTGPGGVLVSGTDLFVFTGAGLVKIDGAKNVTTVSANMDQRANGIVKVRDNEFILTTWGGIVYHVNADGSNHVILDTTAGNIPAGINRYIPETNTMYMTTDQHNTVVAFRIK